MEAIKKIQMYKQTGLNAAHGLSHIAEYRILDALSLLFNKPLRSKELERKFGAELREEVFALWQWDAKNITQGIYSDAVNDKKAFKKRLADFFHILSDYPKVLKRRHHNKTKLKGHSDQSYPNYFKRTFHFQSEGYLSAESAKMYDEQVEILFGGTADLMRRNLLVELAPVLGNFKERGNDVRILELAGGTGAGTRLLTTVLPKAHYSFTDLSPYYVEYAAERLGNSFDIRYHTLDAADTKLPESSYDLVFHIFLFHELPRLERVKVLEEMRRVLKPGGHGVIIDSIQIEDMPRWRDILIDFPKRYHEPFYRNYLEWNMDSAVKSAGLELVSRSRCFLSTCLVFKRPE